jgi:PKHD-type hydroxylase
MNTVNEWFFFNDPINVKTCNKLKRLASKSWEASAVDVKKDHSPEERKTGRQADFKSDLKTRISDIAWTNEQWVYDLIWPYMLRANEDAGWRYDITSAESAQITRYKKGGFYSWHRDGFNDHLSKYNQPDNPWVHEKVRKLSMTILLNDSFEGGEFEVMTYNKGKGVKQQPFENPITGQVIVFPSFMEHRVAPVTKGTRYSAVIWFLGPPMR